MKVTVIGGGSTYTPELAEGLIQESLSLRLDNVTLYDIDEKRLKIVGGLVKRMVEAKGSPFNVVLTTDRREAISGADFVITQIRVGGQQARHDDTLICLAEGIIGQETTGPVGFAKALRTIPMILDICEDMDRFAPSAWLINFTNPAGIVTEAILKHTRVRAIGLCNVPLGMRIAIAKEYGVSHESVDLDYVGLNHLSWVRGVYVGGVDRTQEVLAKADKAKVNNIPELNVNSRFLQALAMSPNAYLNNFYLNDEMVEHLKSQQKTRAQIVAELETRLLEQYADANLYEKPKELEKRGGAHYSTAAISLIKDIFLNTGAKHIVNVRNNGALSELADDVVIEVNAVVNARGAQPITIGKLEPEIRGLIQHVKSYEELTVEAAVSRDYDTALLALSSHPLVHSVNKAQRLLERFIDRHNLPLKNRT